MNYKRFSRFFCLAAACCVILAGAAAPLTAYAAEDDGSAELDVAQETRTLSGTWRFNDVLTVPEWLGDSAALFEFDFTVSPGFKIPDDNSKVELTGAPYFSYGLVISQSTNSDSFGLIFEGPDEMLIPYSSEDGVGWNFTYLFVSELAGVSNASVLEGWGQTITLTHAQEVPVAFYEWFTANAVKQVSPMETFLDNFTAPISGIWSVVTDVSNTIVSTPLLLLAFCFAFLGMCVSIFGRILSRS